MTKFIPERTKYITVLLTVIFVFLWASRGTELSLTKFISGFPSAKVFIVSMYPPDFSILPRLFPRIVETLQIAIVSIILASLIALPVAFLAARNTTPNYPVYKIIRFILGMLRSIPSLLYALIFICMVGLGPFPGIIGLVLHCTGALGKYFSESIENVNPRIIDAVKSTGANKLQVILYGIIPELKPVLLGYILYYFEYCIRTSAILGIVGAGGIGMELLTSIRLFRNQQVFTILIVIVVIVTIVDSISFAIRRRIIGLKTW